MANKWGNNGNSDKMYFFELQNHFRWWLQPWNYKSLGSWKKSYDKLRQHTKNRDITLPTKVHLVKAIAFPLVMYRYESWTVKNVECWRIDAFQLWCWRRLLRVPWTARRSNQSVLKEINPEYSLEGLILKLKLQYFGHLMWKANSLEKTLMLGKIEGRRRRGQQRMRWLDGIIDSKNMNLGKLWGVVRDKEVWCASIHGITKSWTQLGDWTTMGSWEVPPMSLGHCEKIPSSTENSRGFSSCIKRKNEN